MRPWLKPILALALVAGAAPVLAQTCEDLQKQIAELTGRVASLEARLATLAPSKTPPAAAPATASRQAVAAPAAAPSGRDDALALYTRVDNLVARGALDEAKQTVAEWDRAHAGTPGAGWTNALNRELAVVGKSAPADWEIDHWYQGGSDVRLDGQGPTLVVFWEAWCPHCREEVPKVEAIWERYRSRGLQVLGVTRITQTATEESVKAFITDSGVRYPMAKESGALAEYFEVKGIPAAAVVKDGKIVWRGHPLRVTDELLSAWL